MEKVNLPKGLIKYTSEEQIVKGTPFKFTTRIKSYTAVLTVLVGILMVMLTLRNDVEANVLRIRGQLYQTTTLGWISNVYSYKIVNKTTSDITDVTLKLAGFEGTIKLVSINQTFTVPKQGLAEGTLLIEIPKSKLKKDKTTLKIEVYSKEKHRNDKGQFYWP